MTEMSTRGASINILHIDDEPDFADLAAEYLKREDDRFAIETANNASEGLDRLADEQFDCIVSDYDMPGQNGIELLQTVREEYPELPVILFTGKGSEEVASDAISAGVTDYLQKGSGTEQYEILANRIINTVDQHRAQRRAQRERRRFQTLFDRLSQPTVEVEYKNNEPIVQRANPAFEDVFGYDTREITGASLDEYIVPDTREDEATDINQYVQTGGRLESREVMRQTDEGLREFLLQNAVYEDGSGGFAIYTDITERNDRKKNLERSQELLRHTEQLAGVGGWEADNKSGHMRWTQGTYEIHDLTPDGEFDPTVETGLDFYHPDDQATIETAVENCRTHGEPYELELRVITAEDNKKWVSTYGEPVYHGDEIVKIRGAIQDITRSKEREKQLQQFEHMVTYSPEFLVVMDEDMRIKYQSPPSQLLNWEPIDGSGEDPLKYIHPNDRKKIVQHSTQIKQQPHQIATVEFRAQDADGDWRWVEARTQSFVDDDAVGGILAAIRDITPRKQREQQLDAFAKTVSHDLRNPLSVATGRLNLLQEECDSDHLASLDRSLERMENLIDTLLMIARGDNDVTEWERVELTGMARECWQTVKTEDARLGIDVERAIRADGSRLRHLFENLYRNAVEHGDEDVMIRIGELPDGFYVEDSGPGIPEDERDDVFAAGYSTNSDGTGLGLHIVKQVADAHNWKIRVTEGSDKGARFEFTNVEFVD